LKQSHVDPDTTLANPHDQVMYDVGWDLPQKLALNSYLYSNDAISDSTISAHTNMNVNRS